MSKIAVTGSLHYDIMLDAHHRPEKGETVMGTACRYKFGGKGGNQAIAAASAGAAVCFIGAVGADEQGRFLLNRLQQAGVETQHVAVLNDMPSGMSVAITDAEGDYGAVVVSNANQHISCLPFAQADFWQGVSMLVLQNEVPEAVNLAAAQAARQQHIPVCINAAPARPLSAEFERSIDVLVVNAVEARDMSGIVVTDLSSAQQAATQLAARFPCVVVTAGEHGVAFSEAGNTQTLPARKVTLVSTHGAGDCFMGVLCQALADGEALALAVAKANDAAATHVSQPIR
ncbi:MULTISPECIES: PfkB family carbohydrate kinase [Pantoea]|uniref:Carbohydrate kinase n=1 Tax=Pantoea stewartii TaxID=66269 RepID=A0AB34VNW2_9GAMM|nr:PfkB family carbohydrate kinase [Pantoea stewartii]KTS73749.1 carbohydrate kinase [Pantoea stewartii]KTT01329.1 carbohydrate kinase [Pantoea stewartii]KTT08850.1 carbohydrate kinase [Pantoea stewartii]WHT00800.1 MAG: ribokinase [Pantoea stewartii]